MPDRELLVRILGDDRDLQRALANTDKRLTAIDNRTQTFGRNVGRAFAAAGIAVGAAEITRAVGASVQAASALNEEVAKSGEIFGDSAEAVQEWSTTTARSLGISQVEALRAAGTFGNLFRVVEIGQQDAAGMSQALVQLAADLASFNNANPEEVLAAIRSGLIGEAEPLRRFGVLLSEARVQEQALITTGKQTVQSLTDQEKALARYELILRDTVIAQGDVARTQDSFANQSRQLQANVDDLAAKFGNVLLPSILALTTGANAAVEALERIGDVEVGGLDVSSIAGWVSGWSEINFLVEQVNKGLKEANAEASRFQIPLIGEDVRESPGRIAARNRAIDAIETQKATDRFEEHLKGLGLKLDKAELTKEAANDLAVLRETERSILRRIEQEGRTFELVQLLTDTRRQINSVLDRQAQEARQAGIDAFNATVDALSLELDMARVTKSLADDQVALRALETAILRRISTEGQTTDLLRQLFNVRQEQADVARQLSEQRRKNRQSRQFEALGLTAEGDERAPSEASLRRRGQSLEKQIEGTALDTKKNRELLDNAAKVLSGAFGKVGREVRQAIKRMFDEIADALKDDSDVGGQITPGGIRPLQRLVAGANLTEEQLAILQRNMQRRRRGRPINAFGVDLDAGGLTSGTFKAGGGTITIEPQPINLFIDGEKITNIVVKRMQKTGKRRTNRRGGAAAGRGAVL